MTTELSLLGWSVLIGLLHLGAAALAKRAQEPPMWAAGNRDEGEPRYTGAAARLVRAQSNFMETFPLFAAAVLVAHLAGREGAVSVWGAGLYVAGRAAYLPLYGFGVPYVRTAAWLVATAGLVAVLFVSLWP